MKLQDIAKKDRSLPKTTIVARTKSGMRVKYPEASQDFSALMSAMTEETKAEYFNRLENELGIVRLGHGGFARVFQHPTHPDVAVKVFTDTDEAYHSYLKFVLKHQHNKYVPKILSVHQHTHTPSKDDARDEVDRAVDDKYTIVFLEKLQPASEEFIRAFIRSLPVHADSTNGFRSITREKWIQLAKQSKDSDLIEFAKYIIKVSNEDSFDYHFLDMHHKNIMRRGDQLVFVDPTS